MKIVLIIVVVIVIIFIVKFVKKRKKPEGMIEEILSELNDKGFRKAVAKREKLNNWLLKKSNNIFKEKDELQIGYYVTDIIEYHFSVLHKELSEKSEEVKKILSFETSKYFHNLVGKSIDHSTLIMHSDLLIDSCKDKVRIELVGEQFYDDDDDDLYFT